MASRLFRLLAALGREMVVADTFGSFAQIVLFILGGFLISREKINRWWIWGYWSSPLMYAQNAIAVNEFLGQSWQKVVNATANETLGVHILKVKGMFVDPNWYWIGVAALLGYIFLFNILFIFFLHRHDPLVKSRMATAEEASREKHNNRTEETDLLYAESGPNRSIREERRDAITSGQNGSDTKNRKEGMVLPFTPLSIIFDEVSYVINMPQEIKEKGIIEERLQLLKGVSGAFRPGVLTALMGVSGASKTTLMDVLSGRKTNDIHSPHVTVYESLVYSAWLRLPADIDKETRKMFIEEVMKLVELSSLRGSLVGLPGVNGLATEQRKRLTIAVELVANPSIIFMDEPTSGLDARAAAIVMRTIRNTVDTGRTVVCTIHQPSIDIFEAFDELFLMRIGGEEIYVGPLGCNSCNLINYFEDIEGVRKISDGYNPATWMLEVTSRAQEDIMGVNFADIYKNSNLYRRNKALISELSTPHPGTKDLSFQTKYSQPFLVQCLACLWKQHYSYWHNPSYTATSIFFTVVIALILGTIFLRFGGKVSNQQDLLDSLSSMYIAVMFIGMQNSQTVQPIIDVERTVFYREKGAGMYSAIPYSIAQVLIEIPHIFLQTMVYGLIVYSCLDLDWTAQKFFWYIFFMFFTFMYFTFYGMMAVALTPNKDIAAIVSAAFHGIWNIFAGYLIPRPRIPAWWSWYCWACPVAWTLYGLAVSQYGDSTKPMDEGGTVQEFLMSYFRFKDGFLGWAVVAVVGFTMLFVVVFALAIKYCNFHKR